MAMRSARHCGWGALFIAVVGCLGGQTGQPGSLNCQPQSVALDEPVKGVTPEAFISAFEGTHVATLVWNVPDAPAEDVITLELRRDTNGTARTGCGDLTVGVHVEISTRDHGVLASRGVTLRGIAGKIEQASFDMSGERAIFSADLVASQGEVMISGTLTTNDATLPALTATFPAPDGLSGAGGGR